MKVASECPKGHAMLKGADDRLFNCDLCGRTMLRGPKLCCHFDGCDYDICAECVTVERCQHAHLLQAVHSGWPFKCNFCEKSVLAGQRLMCRTNGCNLDICVECSKSSKCPRSHRLKIANHDRQYTCDVCDQRGLTGWRLCCKAPGCDHDVCAACARTAKCPRGHLLQQAENHRRYNCDLCHKRDLTGLRLCCKCDGCDFDICADCTQNGRCPRKHQLKVANRSRQYFCDICNKRDLVGLRLCCKRAGCDYDACPECVETARCPRDHLLRVQDTESCYNCDICSARNRSGWRLCCHDDGCDFDVCLDCVTMARCASGHLLRSMDCISPFTCNICEQHRLSGWRLSCKGAGKFRCNHNVCAECVKTSKCPRGHLLQRRRLNQEYSCSVCRLPSLRGVRLCCEIEGCKYTKCHRCMQGILLFNQMKTKIGMDARTLWERRDRQGFNDDKLFQLRLGSQEYNAVQELFHRTMPSSRLEAVWRIENGAQHELYSAHKTNVRKELGPAFNASNMVQLLFHGTSHEAVEDIINSDSAGFLPLLAGTSTGAMLGLGTYFARDASYSARYACTLPSGQRQMLLAEVVVGLWAQGAQGMRTCPLLPGSRFRRHHSLVDDPADPAVFVVQHSSQAYPAYLLAFR